MNCQLGSCVQRSSVRSRTDEFVVVNDETLELEALKGTTRTESCGGEDAIKSFGWALLGQLTMTARCYDKRELP